MSTTGQLRDDRDERIIEDESAEFSGLWPDSDTVSGVFLEFERSAEKAGRNPEIYFNHGMRLLELGTGLRLEEHAIAAFHKCTELAPRDASAFYHLGIAYMLAQNTEEAIKAFERAAELEPRSPDVLMGLIYANIAREDYNLSNAWVERLIDISSDKKNGVVLDARIFYCWYAVMLALTDRPEEAESYFMLALEASGEPSSFADTAHFGLGYIALKRNDSVAAQQHLHAIRNYNSDLYLTLAEAIHAGELNKEQLLKTIVTRTGDNTF